METPGNDINIISYLLEPYRRWYGPNLTFYKKQTVKFAWRLYDIEKSITEEYYLTFSSLKRHGPCRKIQNGMLLLSTRYINDEEDGVRIEYNEKGQLRSITNMKHSVRHGFHVRWDDEGKVVEKAMYSYGSILN